MAQTCFVIKVFKDKIDIFVAMQQIVSSIGSWILVRLFIGRKSWKPSHSIAMNSRATQLKFVGPRMSHYAFY